MSERSLTVEDLLEARTAASSTSSSPSTEGDDVVQSPPSRAHASSSSRSLLRSKGSLKSALGQSSLRNLVNYDLEADAVKNDNKKGASSSDLPNDVATAEQVEELPIEYQSGDPKRPLKLTDAATGESHHYALKPLAYSASFVILLHLAESFSTYGVEGIITPFLVGSYDESWNANRTSVAATSYVSGVASIASVVPFVGGIIADGYLGDYWTLLMGAGLFYVPGLLLLGLATIPFLLGSTFNQAALTAALLGLCPIGAGLVKPITNVFGAKQFHPILQSSMIETYYIYYFQALNVGALGGGIIVPLLAQWNDTAAFLVPAALLTVGAMALVAGSRRYVTMSPRRDALGKTLQVISCCPRHPRNRASVRAARQLVRVVAVSALKVPFDIAYCQMTTVFSVQALAMQPVGFIDAAMMLNANAMVSLLFGVVLTSWLYPTLRRRGIHLGITHKFAIGTALAAGAILAAILVDYAIHDAIAVGSKISILWQTVNYAFIGIGELFVVATCFEAAFVIAPKDQKGLSSAINLFMLAGLPNFISIGLYNAFSSWFPPGSPADTYGDSQVYKYLWLLFGITVAGTVLVLLPPVTNWVNSIYEEALKSESQKSMDDLFEGETEIIFTDDSSESEDEGGMGKNPSGRTTMKHDANHPFDTYLASSNMCNYFVVLEMQDVLSICDSDDHSYHPDSYTGSDADEKRAATSTSCESNRQELSLHTASAHEETDVPVHSHFHTSSTRCDCESVSSLYSNPTYVHSSPFEYDADDVLVGETIDVPRSTVMTPLDDEIYMIEC